MSEIQTTIKSNIIQWKCTTVNEVECVYGKHCNIMLINEIIITILLTVRKSSLQDRKAQSAVSNVLNLNENYNNISVSGTITTLCLRKKIVTLFVCVITISDVVQFCQSWQKHTPVI